MTRAPRQKTGSRSLPVSGAAKTPPIQSRSAILKERYFGAPEVPELLPLESDSFFPLESLAYGGLGAGWGLGCCAYSDAELRAAGLTPEAMRAAYQWVADRIGISGERDDERSTRLRISNACCRRSRWMRTPRISTRATCGGDAACMLPASAWGARRSPC